MLAHCGVKKKHKFTTCNVLRHLGRELVSANHSHIGIIVIAVIQYARNSRTHAVIATQTVSEPDDQNLGHLAPRNLMQSLTVPAL